MIFLWNPTDENMAFGYAGLSYTLEAGKRMKVEEAMGKHVLNNLTGRGMTKLVFDDDGRSINEEQIAADARERNKDFKIKQIVTYNERNERRKASGQPYDVPTAAVKKYAIELGIDLLQPYTMAEGEKGQIGKLSRENDELKGQVATLMDQMQKMMTAIAGGNSVQPEPEKKKINDDELIECRICHEKVLRSRIRSHVAYKHNIKKEMKDESQPVPI